MNEFAPGLIPDEQRRQLFLYARARLRDDDDAEEITQQTIFKALRALREQSPRDGVPLAYLRTIALNLIIERSRSARFKRTCSLDELQESGFDAPSDERVFAGMESRERQTRVQSAVAKLSDDHRKTVILHYWHGLECQEIARLHGVAEGTVKSRLSRAREALARSLATMP